MRELELLSSTISRLIEQAADEIARLDTYCALAAPAVGIACRLSALDPCEEGTPSALALLIAAAGDAAHDSLLPPRLRRYRDFIAAEEQRVRGGAPLAAARFVAAGFTVADPSTLDAALRAGGQPRAALVRACAGAAVLAAGPRQTNDSTPPALPSAVAALVLSAAGVTDQLRLLPLIELEDSAVAEAIAGWRTGEPESWLSLALTEFARAARARRLALADGAARERECVARLDALGRAAISARSAHSHLQSQFAASIPSLANAIGLSRPAAGAAFERLVEAGLAVEVTGRGRDRVFALASSFNAIVT